MVKEKKIYCSYYTNSNSILDYMVNKIDLKAKILEPCGGDGAFIDAILNSNNEACIDTLDNNPSAVKNMKEKYKDYHNINIWFGDTLFDDTLDQRTNYYDSVIGNPPYGAWQSEDRKKDLKSKYNNCYVKESYTMFLTRCVSLLKDNGTLCFIVPDTFLYLHMHEKLRKMLLTETLIKDITIFPSKLFPGVHFGYAKLAIISLQKISNQLDNKIKIFNNVKKEQDFKNITDTKCFEISQREVLDNKNSAFEFYNENIDIQELKKITSTLSDYAECVTGIYTGDNVRFIKRKNENVKNSKNYQDVDINDKNYIPLIKGTSPTAYVGEDNWFIDWSEEAINFYNSNGRARFQNSEYYFKKGIAYPMVKSKNSKAIIMENRVFDQSIVGIFPKDYKYLYYLLGFINTKLFYNILNSINPSANGSANYIKKIPFKIPNESVVKKVTKMVKEIIEDYNNYEENQTKIDKIINELYFEKRDDYNS